MKKTIINLVTLLLIHTSIFATEFNVDKSKKNMVKFISDAPVEDFEGVTDIIDGYMYWEGDDMMNKSILYFEVDLTTLDTGIGLRNRHMRDNYLETDKFKYSSYEGKFKSIRKISDSEFEVEVDGTMNIHGITKTLPVKGKMIKTDNGYRILSQFDVKLTDYQIEVPKLMFVKISEVMELHVDFFMKQKK
ncbi:MAG: YceI family protein [bacterium]